MFVLVNDLAEAMAVYFGSTMADLMIYVT